MQYKVGDKVRIRQDLQVGRRYGGVTARKKMKENFGAVGTIELIHNNAYRLSVSGFWWSEEMLEGVDKMGNVKIKIAVDGNKVIAKMGKETGIAKCSPEDEFDIFTGVRLAIDRLEEKCKPYAWLKRGVRYYHPAVLTKTLVGDYPYIGDIFDERVKERGLAFRTKEEAIEAAKKMLAVLKEGDSNG